MVRARIDNTTCILQRVADGDSDAETALFDAVYSELRHLACRHMHAERPGHTLQPTALVHEVYLKLIRQQDARWNDRAHFLAVAARAMRQILINHALARKAAKRGGDRQRTPLSQVIVAADNQALDLGELNEALVRLAHLDPRQGRIVELRFFGGLTNKEVAEVLGVSLRTVEGEWSMARAWLLRELQGGNGDDAGTLA